MVATRKTSSLDSSTWNRAGAGVDVFIDVIVCTYLWVGDDSGREFGKGCKLVRKEMVMILQVLFQSDSTVSRVIFSYPYHWWTVVIKEFKAANCRFVVIVRDSLNQKVRDSGVHIRLFRNWSVVAAMECHTFSKGQRLVKQKEGVRFIRGWKNPQKITGFRIRQAERLDTMRASSHVIIEAIKEGSTTIVFLLQLVYDIPPSPVNLQYLVLGSCM